MQALEDATALCGGVSRSLALSLSGQQLAANVSLHGTSPWHPKNLRQISSSRQRETPTDKPGASLSVFK